MPGVGQPTLGWDQRLQGEPEGQRADLQALSGERISPLPSI